MFRKLFEKKEVQHNNLVGRVRNFEKGDEFNHLGQTLTVFKSTLELPYGYPQVTFHYINNHGEIKDLKMHVSDAEKLERANAHKELMKNIRGRRNEQS